nr:vomeronasal type-2 receptor 116-like [Cavia porcellus]
MKLVAAKPKGLVVKRCSSQGEQQTGKLHWLAGHRTSAAELQGKAVENSSKDIEEAWLKEVNFIKASTFWCHLSNDDCLQSTSTRVYKDGDVVIGGFFSLYTCLYFTGMSHLKPSKDFLIVELMPNNYQNVLAFIFAIEEINKNPHLLPNISLGYEYHNLLYSYWKLLDSFLILHTGQNGAPNYRCGTETKSVALLTGSPWAISSQIGQFLELYKFPQLTFGTYEADFNENGQFPSLHQVAPKDASLALGMVFLMLHFSWTWVGLVIAEGHNGFQFLSDVRGEMDRNGICVAFVKMISNALVSYLANTEMRDFLTREISPVNVVIIYYDTDSLNHINHQIGLQLVTWRVWVTNSQWHTDLAGRNFILDSFHGTLILYKEYPFQLHTILKDLQFNSPVGEQVTLDKKSKVDAKYDILNFWNFPEGLRFRAKVGEFSPHAPVGQQLSLSEEMIEWATGITETPRSVCSESCDPGFRKSPQEGKAACCFDCTPCSKNEIANDTDMEQCTPCPDHQYANTERKHCLQKSETFLDYADSLGKTLAGSALSLTVFTAAVLGLFVKHRDTPIVKANNRALSYTLLFSLTFCFLCTLLFIGRPSTASCILQWTTFAVVFTVVVSTVLAKTITVVLAFKVTAPGRRMRQLLVSGAPNCIIPICTLVQLTLCGIWMGTNPPYVDRDPHSEHGHIIIMCNKGSLTAFYCVLGYLGSLALLSFTVAFLARNLPDTFNEAKFLTFSMLVFCSVWVTFLPVYHSSKGKVMVAMEVFSILASSAGLLGCIFVPKCYIILLRPERNFSHRFGDKTHSHRKEPS